MENLGRTPGIHGVFGQGLAQTPLQTAMVFQAVGNLGVKVKPRIVDAIIDPDGTEHKVPVEGAQRVVSEKPPETA